MIDKPQAPQRPRDFVFTVIIQGKITAFSEDHGRASLLKDIHLPLGSVGAIMGYKVDVQPVSGIIAPNDFNQHGIREKP